MNSGTDNLIVLLVDDEALIRKYFERIFARELNVMTAGGGEEARALLSTYGDRVAVLITDQRMPAGSGVSLLREVRTDYPHIVRLLTTAYSDIDEAIAAINQGEIWRYVTKPWDIAALRATLAAAMEAYHALAYERALLDERLRGMLQVAGHMAHEMRTPLMTIQSAALGVEQYLPTLLEGYDWAARHGADLKPVTKRHRQVLADSTGTMKRVVGRASAVIDLLLANAGAYSIDPALFEPCAISECVRVALDEFPFRGGERDMVSWTQEPEFYFNGSVNLMVLVLHNLLRNAIRAIAAAGGGEVSLWTSTGEDNDTLHIKDTGTGIPAEQLSRIFDDFVSLSDDHGAGMGLSFCRKVMASFGGRIECHTEKDRYTQFDLWLPVVDGQVSKR